MLNKTLINLNISILKNEKDRLIRAIENCKESRLKDDEYTLKHIAKMEKKIKNIDRIIEHYKNIEK